MPFVVWLLAGIKIVPVCIVDRNAAILRIPVIHVFAAAVVLGTPEILWVVDIRVVIKAVPILGVVRASPTVSVCLLSLGSLGIREQAKAESANEREAGHTNHRKSPPGMDRWLSVRGDGPITNWCEPGSVDSIGQTGSLD